MKSEVCQSALERGSDSLLVMFDLSNGNDAGLEEVDLSATVHLAFHELEFGDLAFGLACCRFG